MTSDHTINTSPMLPPRELARKAEAAIWLGLSERTLHALIADGLPTLRPTPGVVLVDLPKAVEWLRERGGRS
ncbi:MAG: hypothetical protein IT445_13455 [Phycisphaeraceae bacterium]|nr:hypothetical protein [Phycisphaeraceae bacterium]